MIFNAGGLWVAVYENGVARLRHIDLAVQRAVGLAMVEAALDTAGELGPLYGLVQVAGGQWPDQRASVARPVGLSPNQPTEHRRPHLYDPSHHPAPAAPVKHFFYSRSELLRGREME